jgi:hypothetical protein
MCMMCYWDVFRGFAPGGLIYLLRCHTETGFWCTGLRQMYRVVRRRGEVSGDNSYGISTTVQQPGGSSWRFGIWSTSKQTPW